MVVGFIVLVIGIIFLLKNLDILQGDVWDIVWPCLIVAVALGMLLKRKHPFYKWEHLGKKWHKKFHEEN